MLNNTHYLCHPPNSTNPSPCPCSCPATHAGGMFSRMMGAACSLLRTLGDISERPDIADDTFLLAGRALNYAPRLVVTPLLLPVLLDSALAGLLVQHREACCSILAFVVRLLEPNTHRACGPEAMQHLQAALAPRAPLLLRLLLAGVAGALPTNRLAELTDVLYALLKVGGVLSVVGAWGMGRAGPAPAGGGWGGQPALGRGCERAPGCGPVKDSTVHGALPARRRCANTLLLVLPPASALAPRRLQVTSQSGLQWVGEALAGVPEEAATSADKQRFMGACQKVVADGMAVNDQRVLQQAVDEFSELCRRHKRAAQMAQRALLPAELHYTIR